MRRPSLIGGLAFAFAAAVFAIPLWWGLRAVLPFWPAVRVLCLGIHMAYLFYLLRVTDSRIGTVTLIVTNAILAAGILFLPLATPPLVFALLILLSLNRVLLFHRSVPAILLDSGVAVAGLFFALYLFSQTASIAAGVWGLFLLQPLFVLIPRRLGGSEPAGAEREAVDPFVRGHRQAEAALQRIVQEEAF